MKRGPGKMAAVGVAMLLVALVFASSASAAGTVRTWGFNFTGALGAGASSGPSTCGTVGCSTKPVAVLSAATAIAGGYDHSLAVRGGRVVSWGDNSLGELGYGTSTGPNSCPTACSVKPRQLKRPTNAVAVAAGVNFSLALLSNGTVEAWGDNDFGELGIGTASGPATCGTGFSCSTKPVVVPGLSNVKAIAAGGSHALALLNDGTVMAWGANFDGQLGDGTSSGPVTCNFGTPCSPTPVVVPRIAKAFGIAAGNLFSLAIVQFTPGVTHVEAWGDNASGQLGQGTTSGPSTCPNGDPCSRIPVQVTGLSGDERAVAANAGAGQALVRSGDGSVAAWGNNQFGQSGSACGTPFCPSPKLVPGVSGATQIATSGSGSAGRSMALESSGQVVEWGSSPLGDGTYPGGSATPVNVLGMNAESAIAAGGLHSLAIGPPPPNKFSVGLSQCQCSIVTLHIHVPAPGLLTLHQRGTPSPGPGPGPLLASVDRKKKPLVKAVVVTVKKAGKVKVKVKLTARGKKKLKRSHKLRVKVVITFTPNGGTPRRKTITVTFRKRK
ncbi:MAG: hypothetical protein JOZ73_14605 [Solirubrobacterales bacterium]|nr:hypothetical protein [Solirubrobacterales bacterium]